MNVWNGKATVDMEKPLPFYLKIILFYNKANIYNRLNSQNKYIESKFKRNIFLIVSLYGKL